RPGQGLDAKDDLAIQEDAHRTGRLADRDRDGLRLPSDCGGGPVTSAQALAQRNALRRGVDVHAAGDRDTVAADDDRPIELGDFFNLFADLPIADIALGSAVTAEGIVVLRPRHAQHTLRVADDKQCANRHAFAALATNFGCYIDHGAQRFKWDLRIK